MRIISILESYIFLNWYGQGLGYFPAVFLPPLDSGETARPPLRGANLGSVPPWIGEADFFDPVTPLDSPPGSDPSGNTIRDHTVQQVRWSQWRRVLTLHLRTGFRCAGTTQILTFLLRCKLIERGSSELYGIIPYSKCAGRNGDEY